MIAHCNIYILKGNCLVLSFLIQIVTENALHTSSHFVLTISFNRFITFIKWSKNCNSHSHKKQEDILEGSLDQVLIPAELDFSKILIPRQFQHTSNVNIECARKSEWSKQLYSLYVTSLLKYWYILILLFSY